jgi:hypothetical protein
MGSSSTRSKNQDGVGVGVRADSYNNKPLICPRAFSVPLPIDVKIAVGAKVNLESRDGALYVKSGILTICALSKQRSTQILQCIGMGFKYSGEVKKNAKEELYAEFAQSR